MITRAIDSDHDWTFGKGRQNYLSENAALAQNINTRLMSFKNDCYFDLDAGIDWFFYLGSKQISALKIQVASVITATVGVQSLTEINFSVDESRNLTVQYTVISLWSTTPITGIATL